MVVVHAQPSTSAPTQKKNRRKLSKKRTAGDQDAGMQRDTVFSSNAGANNAAEDDDDVMIDTEDAGTSTNAVVPAFGPLSASAQRTMLKSETRRIPIPPHRMTPLKKEWVNIFGPLTEMLGLQVRMNVPRRCVEIRVCAQTCRLDSYFLITASPRHRSTPKRLARFKRALTLSNHSPLGSTSM